MTRSAQLGTTTRPPSSPRFVPCLSLCLSVQKNRCPPKQGWLPLPQWDRVWEGRKRRRTREGEEKGGKRTRNRQVDLVFSSWWNTSSLDSIVKLSVVPPSRNLLETVEIEEGERTLRPILFQKRFSGFTETHGRNKVPGCEWRWPKEGFH